MIPALILLYFAAGTAVALSRNARIQWTVSSLSHSVACGREQTRISKIRFFCGVALLWPIFLYLWRAQTGHSKSSPEIDEEWCPLISAKPEDLRYEVGDHSSEEYAEAMEWLRDQHKDGDQVWRFSTSHDSWGHLAGRSGFVLLREGKIVAEAVTMMN